MITLLISQTTILNSGDIIMDNFIDCSPIDSSAGTSANNVNKVNHRDDVGYSRAQSHIDYFMNHEYAQHPDKCNIYEKSHLNSVPMALYSDVVDIESELINRTRKWSKCSSRHVSKMQCMSCGHGQQCTTSNCLSDGGTRNSCESNIVNHPDYGTYEM